MASETTEIVEHSIYRSSLRDGAKGVIQVDHDTTDVSLYGSLTNVNFVLIETFTASAVKEIALTPFIGVATGTNATRTKSQLETGQNFGNTEIYINETR